MTTRRVPLGAYLISAYGLITAVAISGLSHSVGGGLYLAAAGAVAQAVATAASPSLRLDIQTPLSPGNWALGAWYYLLVINPFLLVTFGPDLGRLQALPPTTAINATFIVQTFAYLAFAVAYVRARRGERSTSIERIPRRATWIPSLGLIGLFVTFGVIGLVLRFPSLGSLVDYYTGSAPVPTVSGPTTLNTAASFFLRPFLGVAFVLIFARWNEHSLRWFSARSLVPFLGIALVYSSYSYSRGTLVVAIVALLAGAGRQLKRVSALGVVTLIIAGALVAFVFGNYRTLYFGTQGGRITAQAAGLQDYKADPVQQLEIYTGAPQFIAVMVRASDYGLHPLGPRPIVHDVLSPVPILGKGYRVGTTTDLYNQLVYGRSDVIDQFPSFAGELIWCFGPLVVIIGFIGLGLLLGRLDRKFAASNDLVGSVICQYTATWLSFLLVGGVAVLAQALIYFFPPFILILIIRWRSSQIRTGSTRAYSARGQYFSLPARVLDADPTHA